MSELLSQDQIDQLLSMGGFAGEGGGGAASPGNGAAGGLHSTVEVFCAQAESVLATVLTKKVSVQTGPVTKADFIALGSELSEDYLCLSIPLKAGLAGEMYLFVKKRDAAVMADLMMAGDGNAAYGPAHNDAMTELTNQINSSFTLALTTSVGKEISAGQASIVPFSLQTPPAPPDSFDMAMLQVSIENREDMHLALLVPGELSAQMAEKSPAGDSLAGPSMPEGFSTEAPGASFVETPPGGKLPRQKESIEMLLDVDLDVSIELGRSMLSIKRILELAPGSIIELDRMAGEPVDLLVNNKTVAKGEVVVIDESFGIRILSLVSPEERIKSLK